MADLVKKAPIKPCKRGHTGGRNKDGRCIECRREASRKWFFKNRETSYERRNKQYAENPEKGRERSRKWYAENTEKGRERSRKSYFKTSAKRLGIPEPTRPMPEHCECCGKHRGSKMLCRDHDHKTGRFRGWICLTTCNPILGLLGDNYGAIQLRLRQMADYLNMADLT